METVETLLGIKFKDKQRRIIQACIDGKDVIGLLPTGYGKSVCFGAVPLVLDKLKPATRHIAVVISPLISLITDQVHSWSAKGVVCAALHGNEPDSEAAQRIREGNLSMLFATPEGITSVYGHSLLNSPSYRKRVCLLVFDEAHCIHEWGFEFRPKYREVGDIRSLVCGAPVAVFTATSTCEILNDLKDILLLEDTVETVAIVPDRPNMTFVVKKSSSYRTELDWLVQDLIVNGRSSPKTLIFCRSVSHAAEIYQHLVYESRETVWVDESTGVREPSKRLVDIFHKSLLDSDKVRVTREFVKNDSVIRCVVCTVAFGMGVDVPDVRNIVHWGCSKSPLSYWQEVGRGGRDGEQCMCHLHITPYSLHPNQVSQEMIDICKSTKCLRLSVLDSLKVPGMDLEYLRKLEMRMPCEKDCEHCNCVLCCCCTRCRDACKCNKSA